MPRCPTRVGQPDYYSSNFQTFKLSKFHTRVGQPDYYISNLRREKVGLDGEASENPEDWGECHSDCPLRAYRNNQVNTKRGCHNWGLFELSNIKSSG